jgi:hypothetical protein
MELHGLPDIFHQGIESLPLGEDIDADTTAAPPRTIGIDLEFYHHLLSFAPRGIMRREEPYLFGTIFPGVIFFFSCTNA